MTNETMPDAVEAVIFMIDVDPPRVVRKTLQVRRVWPPLDVLRSDASQAQRDLRVILNHASQGPSLVHGAIYPLNRRDPRGYRTGLALIDLMDRLLV
jgi:hypothetical protein